MPWRDVALIAVLSTIIVLALRAAWRHYRVRRWRRDWLRKVALEQEEKEE